MKKILLPTDFSNNAWNAIVYALEFFKNEKCEFHILHTYTPTFYRLDYMMGGPIYSAVPDPEVHLAQEGLEKTLEDIKKKFDNKKHTFKTLSAFNTLVNEIVELSEKYHYDIIVMGTKGATGAKEIFMGTNTVHVLRKSNVPVLAIPFGFSFRPITSILFPSDYANPFKKEDLAPLLFVAQIQKSTVKVLFINSGYELTDAQKTNKESLAVKLKGLDFTFDQVTGKLLPNTIQAYVQQNNIGLLAMMNRKHSFLNRLMVRSNVDDISYHVQVPFLVMRDSLE